MRKLAVVAAIVAAAVVAGAAWAAPGDLSPAGCIEDNDVGPDGCTVALGADGLEQARDVLVAPDGGDVYAVGFDDEAIVPLHRNTSTGGLEYVESCISDTQASAEACGNTIGLNGASTVAISPDSNSVYTGSEIDDAIVHFDRDPLTGALDQQICTEDDTAPDANCAQQVDAMNDVRSVVVSPDGEHVYAAGFADSAIQILDRNTASGAISDADCVEDATVGASGCATSSEGLQSVRGIAISPDGASVYTLSEGDDAIIHFSRNSGTGALTFVGCFADDGGGGEPTCTQTPGLSNAYAAAVSPDGASVYVAANSDHAIKRFNRSTASGVLDPQGCVDDSGTAACAQSMVGLDSPVRVLVSSDNRSVYASANQSDAVATLDRDPATGALTPSGCVGDDDSGPVGCSPVASGLGGIWGLALSSDGRSLYTGARVDNAVALLTREQLSAAADPVEPVPVPGQLIVVRPVRGTVTAKVPGSSVFVPIATLTAIPVGSEIDTTKGTVSLSSRATGKAVQTAEFKFGRFRVTQSAGANAVTDLKLTGPLGCGSKRRRARGADGGPVAFPAARGGRSLWGSGSGRFRTRGGKGSATTRGTIWQVTDLCTSRTLIKAFQGKVEVRDFVRKRTLVIGKGQTYVAPGPKRRG